MNRLIYCAVLVILFCSQFSLAAPAPAVLPAPHEWTLDVSYSSLQQIMVRLPGGKQPQRFWYMILTMTNKTGMDIDFYPNVELLTDTFQLVPACIKVPDEAFKEIKSRHKNTYPFLERLEKTGPKILQGEDNAKDVVLIWPDFDDKAKEITIFITGLSNETQKIKSPALKDENGQPKDIFLRKTLQLTYTVAGDPSMRSQANVTFKDKSWVMR